MKRLQGPSGQISDNESKSTDGAGQVTRPAILVHAGAEGTEMTFQSGDGEISFTKERIKKIVRNHNKKINALAAGYGGIDKMPVGAFPPILDQHNSDSSHRIIGRLASLLRYEKRNVPGVGNNVPCACADITFIGEDTVKKVGDGRIYHLSIGIDETTDTLGETSAVIEPAAPGAMLLKKGNLNKGAKMSVLKKRLSAHKTKLAKLQTMRESLTTMGKKLTGTSDKFKLSKKEGEVTTKLHGLMRLGKITPAEFGKMNLKKLAALPQDALDTVLEAYNALEPKINPIQMGSSDAIDFAQMGKALEKKQFKNLKSEIKKDFKRLGVKMKGEEEETDLAAEINEDSKKEMSFEKHEDLSKHLSAIEKHLEEGKVEEAKKLACDMKQMKFGEEGKDEKKLEIGDVKSEDYKASMEQLQAQIDELNTQMATMAGMVSEMMEVEKAEGESMEEEAKEHEALEASTDETAPKPGDEKLNAPPPKEEKQLSEEEKAKLAKEEEEKKVKLAKDEEEKEKIKKDLNLGGKAS